MHDPVSCFDSVRERIRTSDPSLRRRVLYPAELRGHTITVEYHIFFVNGINFDSEN